ncbi:GTP-binding domain protein [Necator americanus]|uniref:small monomeric GTPase n=1 Tax=Necator americanus TaxID=51031 RepID=W2SJ33_NECAM|nr:GTP-binding domain protein [Necator americanus]ETN69605.1 GTP-binding domain protein [Necator americanus]
MVDDIPTSSSTFESKPGPSSPCSQFIKDWQERRAYVRPSGNLVLMLTERERGFSKHGVCHVRNRREFYGTVAMDRVVERLFTLESEVMMMMGSSRLESALLRTDCMLFTDDGKYMVVATTAPAPDQLITIPMVYPNHEALPLANYSLEIYTFFTIDLKKGSIAHFVMYNFDRINLTHGVALCGSTMMIMSLQKQVIHMLHVDEHGAMIPLKDIGPSVWDDDALYLFGDCQATPTRSTLYTGLKQRLLTFLYHEAKREGNIQHFLRFMPPYVEKLRMHRAQLFDGHYLLHSSSENPYLDPLYFSIDEKIHSNLMYGRMRFDLGPVKTMRPTSAVREMHVALVGMAGSGKSAIAVKYITKRFIGEYDSTLEDTYCRQDTVAGQPLMVWVMDTVDDASRDEMRWLAWADVYVVVYDVTSQLSLQYAESILERIAMHEHLLCAREHKTILLGNKNDLERYRQVSEAEGEAMAAKYKIQFAESTAAGDPRPLSQLLHTTFHNILTGTRSPSPRLCSSDSEIVTPRKSAFSALRSTSRSSQVRVKAPKPVQLHKTPSLSKIKTGSKLLKLFHN